MVLDAAVGNGQKSAIRVLTGGIGAPYPTHVPMRILHISDIHIGVENYGHAASEAEVDALPAYFAPGVDRTQFVGVSTRLLDFLTTFDWAVDYAITRAVDLVLFSGDAYKNRDPSQTHQREFARRIARLSSAGIPVFLIVGNHDLPHVANRATALEIFPTLAVANVTVGSTLDTTRVETNAGPLQIVALPWIRIGQFMAKEETRDLSLDEITKAVEARLTAHLDEEIAGLDPALPALLCAHVTVSGAKVGSERSMMLGNDHVLSLGAVANPAFDYVALGHIHKHQMLTQNPPVVYPGSIQRIDFSEEHEEKGFMLIELDHAFSEARVRQALTSAFHLAGIERTVHRERRTRLGSEDAERISPMMALRRYLESRNTPDAREKVLVDYAEQLMQEELEANA
jgi:exonuclease SbcD